MHPTRWSWTRNWRKMLNGGSVSTLLEWQLHYIQHQRGPSWLHWCLAVYFECVGCAWFTIAYSGEDTMKGRSITGNTYSAFHWCFHMLLSLVIHIWAMSAYGLSVHQYSHVGNKQLCSFRKLLFAYSSGIWHIEMLRKCKMHLHSVIHLLIY